MRKIKSSTLQVGVSYHLALYSNKDTIIPCEIISRPNTQIGLMEDSDRFVVKRTDTNELLYFRRNNGMPHYLVTDIPGKREGTTVIERVMFFGEDLPPKEAKPRGRKPNTEEQKTTESEQVSDTGSEEETSSTSSEPVVNTVEEEPVKPEEPVFEFTAEDFDPMALPRGKVRIDFYSAKKRGDLKEMARIFADHAE